MPKEEKKVKLNFNVSQYAIVIEMVIIFLVFQLLTGGVFLTNTNINNLILQTCTYATMGCSMVFVMIIGGIDLSAGAVIGFLCAVAATLSVNMGLSPGMTILITLLLGLAIGAFNGFWISVLKMPAFIVTLSGQMIFKGLNLLVGKGVSIGPVSDKFAMFGRSFLPSVFFKDLSFSDSSLLALIIFAAVFVAVLVHKRRGAMKYGFEVPSTKVEILKIAGILLVTAIVGWMLLSYRGVPIAFVILVCVLAVVTFIGNNTSFGRSIYAVGGNPDASKLSGINIRSVTFRVYIMHGLITAIAAIVYLGRIGSSSANTGTNFEFSAITGCILGGTSTLGGSGTAIGACIGCLIMASLDNGMSLMNLGTTWQYLIKGIVLLIAVAIDIVSKQKKGQI